MDEVAPLIGNVLMEFAVFLHRFLIVFGTGLHTAEFPPNCCQLFLRLLQPVGGIGDVSVVRRVEVGHGVFQTQRCFRCWNNRLRLLHAVLIEDVSVKFSRLCFFHRDTFQLPAIPGAAREYSLDDTGLGHANAVFSDIDGGAGFKLMVASSKGIPVSLFLFEFGIAETFRILEENAERLGQLVVLLDERLIIDLFQERRFLFVFGWSGNKVGVSLNIESLLIRQHPIPDIAATAKGVFKKFSLLLVRVEPRLDRAVLHDPPIFGALRL